MELSIGFRHGQPSHMTITQTGRGFDVSGTPEELVRFGALVQRLGPTCLDGWLMDKTREYEEALPQRVRMLTESEKDQIPPSIRTRLGL